MPKRSDRYNLLGIFRVDYTPQSGSGRGPIPMQLVVVRAVRKAVSAATITFATSSITRFLSMILDI